MKKVQKILTLLMALTMPVVASAQDYSGMPATPAVASYAPDQLEQMLAPIALYPDPLIANILMASTYPLEVVEADRWLQNPGNAGLQGDDLAAAMEQQPWDPSVKSLVPFPQVLQTLDHNIEWTEQLGNAFLAQQADVMNAVQHLRYEAERSGSLRSTPQQVVTTQGPEILIQPANPNVIYVPYYNPSVVYGSWAYPDYPPYYFSGASYGYGYGYGGSIGVGLAFGAGIGIIGSLWGWHHWDWHDHRILIDDRRYAALDQGHAPPRSGFWQHDPEHRHGVPYANPSVRAHFDAGNRQGGRGAGGNFRGYDVPHAAVAPSMHNPGGYESRGAEQNSFNAQHNEMHNVNAPQEQRFDQHASQMHAMPQTSRPVAQPQMQMRATPVAQMPQHAAPAFESYSRGQDIQRQEARGAQSRAAAPAPQPQNHPAAAAPHPEAHAGGGGGGGHPAGGNEHGER